MDREWPTTCDRCGTSLKVSSMSFFNEDICCTACLEDEKRAPGYGAAREAELVAVKSGVRNFPGVGLTAADRAFLKARLQARRGDV